MKRWRSIPFPVVVIAAFLLPFGVVSFSKSFSREQWSHSAYAADNITLSGPLRGFAWSSNMGWISFNCKDIGGCQVPYNVSVNENGNFSGHAWSSNIGWIDFGQNDCGPAPHVDFTTGKVTGYAKAVNGGTTDGYSGCIQLSDEEFHPSPRVNTGGVTLDIGTVSNPLCRFYGYAFGSTAIGWVSFNNYGFTNTGVRFETCDPYKTPDPICKAGDPGCATTCRNGDPGCGGIIKKQFDYSITANPSSLVLNKVRPEHATKITIQPNQPAPGTLIQYVISARLPDKVTATYQPNGTCDASTGQPCQFNIPVSMNNESLGGRGEIQIHGTAGITGYPSISHSRSVSILADNTNLSLHLSRPGGTPATELNVRINELVELHWNVSGYQECMASGDWSGLLTSFAGFNHPNTGTEGTYHYRLDCKDISNHTDSKEVILHVLPNSKIKEI